MSLAIKSLKIALKELERFIRDGQHLKTGKPFKNLGDMRSREALANLLICVAMNVINNDLDLEFCSDPTGGDGIIRDKKTGQTWNTEHVLALKQETNKDLDAQSLILNAIENKLKKGPTYATGKILVVFLEGNLEAWHPNRVAKNLPNPLHFNQVWVVGLHSVEEGKYIYNVTPLDINEKNVPIFQVIINEKFDSWEVIIRQ